MRSKRARSATAPRGGVGAIRLEIIVEAPDQRAHALLERRVDTGAGVQLVDQPFRMHPAERVAADVELASVIAEDHHLTQQPMRLDAAPRRPSVAVTVDPARHLQCGLMLRRSRCACQAA